MYWPDTTIYRAIASIAAARPDAPAIVDGDTRWSYADLRDEAQSLAGGLAALGVEPGDRIAVWLANRPAWVTTQLAASILGAAVVAVDTRKRADELRHMLADASCCVLLTETTFLETDYLDIASQVIGGLRTATPDALAPADLAIETVVAVDADELDAYPAVRRYEDVLGRADPPVDPAADTDRPAAVFYTSGTTGEPKGCVHPPSSVLEHSAAIAAHLGVTDQDRVLGALPFAGVWGYNTWLSTLAAGATLIVQRPFEPTATARLVGDHDVTCMSGMAVMFTRTLEAAGTEWTASLERGVVCFLTRSYDEATFERIESAVGFPLVQPYGSSEANSQVFVGEPEAPIADRKRVGGPLVDERQAAKIVDPETGERRAAGEAGELCLKGYNVMANYLGRPDETAATIDDEGWLHTGDVCSRDGDAFIYHSRLDDALRVRGFLVTPREIEVAIDRVAGVGQSKVVGVPHDRHGEVPVAFVRRETPDLDEASILAALADRIADYKQPVRVEFVESFPRVAGPHGEKVRKTDLREHARGLDLDGADRSASR